MCISYIDKMYFFKENRWTCYYILAYAVKGWREISDSLYLEGDNTIFLSSFAYFYVQTRLFTVIVYPGICKNSRPATRYSELLQWRLSYEQELVLFCIAQLYFRFWISLYSLKSTSQLKKIYVSNSFKEPMNKVDALGKPLQHVTRYIKNQSA